MFPRFCMTQERMSSVPRAAPPSSCPTHLADFCHKDQSLPVLGATLSSSRLSRSRRYSLWQLPRSCFMVAVRSDLLLTRQQPDWYRPLANSRRRKHRTRLPPWLRRLWSHQHPTKSDPPPTREPIHPLQRQQPKELHDRRDLPMKLTVLHQSTVRPKSKEFRRIPSL